MFQRCTRRLCDALIGHVLEHIPPTKHVPLSQLRKSIPDELLDIIVLKHRSLAEFLGEYPTIATLKKIDPTDLLIAHRADTSFADTTLAKRKEVSFTDAAEFPKTILSKLQQFLENDEAFSVGKLYASLNFVERKEIRQYGGLLRILQQNTELFTLSPLGLKVALKSKAMQLDDEKPVDFSQEEMPETAEHQNFELAGKSPEDMHYHAVHLIKYMPLDWTLAPEIPESIPIDIRGKHMIAPWQFMFRYLDDFLETKMGLGCRFPLKRLKRDFEGIPDVGIIPSNDELEKRQSAHLAFTSIVRMQWSTPVSWKFLYVNADREATRKLQREDFIKSCIHHLSNYVLIPKNKQAFLPLPPIEIKRTPLWFQVLKNTVPHHYVPLKVISRRLSKGALNEASKAGGLIKWFQEHKNIFELMVPYAATVVKYDEVTQDRWGKIVDTLDTNIEDIIAVRRKHSPRIVASKDLISETLVSVLPRDGTHKPLREVLSMLPIEVIDALPLHVAPFILENCHPHVRLSKNQNGRFFLKVGKNDESQPSIEVFEEKMGE